MEDLLTDILRAGSREYSHASSGMEWNNSLSPYKVYP